MKNYLLVFVGGGTGAAARYWLSGAVYRFVPANFPYGILAVNILGCFIIGLLMTVSLERYMISSTIRVFLTVGILGGFTTFSSFSYETVALLQDGELQRAILNVFFTVAGCLLATSLGSLMGRII